MNRYSLSVLVIFLVFSTSCFDEPDFSEIPKVEFDNIYFTDLDGTSDSLILSFYFEDGLGDIGLEAFETFSPYHQFNLVVDSRDSAVTLTDTTLVPPFYLVDPFVDRPDFDNKVLFSQTDNRPPFDCNDYQTGSIGGSIEIDTFYISENPFHNNIHVDFFRKRNDEYSLIDFAAEFGNSNCNVVDFDGRIPVFEPESLGTPLSGVISYAMLSIGFKQIFRSDPIKIQFYVYDRDLNRSEIAETPDFILENITR